MVPVALGAAFSAADITEAAGVAPSASRLREPLVLYWLLAEQFGVVRNRADRDFWKSGSGSCVLSNIELFGDDALRRDVERNYFVVGHPRFI